MNKSIKVLISILILIIVVGLYYIFYLKLQESKQLPTTKEITPEVINFNNGLTDSELLKTSSYPEAKVLARGDINGDNFEDAIIAEIFCGASCSVNLFVVLNQENKNGVLLENVEFEGYNSGTALKSDVEEIKIDNGIISLTGRGLDCGENCNEERWNIIKTLKYELVDGVLIKLPL